jgi:hypothetical protein
MKRKAAVVKFPRTITIQRERSARHIAPWTIALFAPVLMLLGCQEATALPSFARQTGMPCSRCHTLSFGPALTAYGRQFKLNGYTWGDADSKMPLALMIQGGFSHVAEPLPDAPAPHFATNDNLSVDQVSVFFGGRLSAHAGAFVQVTYSGEDRHTSWDNTDLRYARTISLGGTDAVVGLSINNNPTVQDLWNSTPAWGYPYITSPLVPGPAASPIISGGLAQLVLGATAYTMIHDTLYLEAGAYRGLSDRWLGNLGPGADANPHVKGGAPYWRAALQWSRNDTHYFSVGTFGIDVKLQPDPTVPETDRYTDLGFDATYQYTGDHDRAVTINASLVHEKQRLEATFNAGGSAAADDHLNVASLDASYIYRQTWSAGMGLFDTRGNTDQTLYSPGALTGSNSGSPDTRGYTLQLEYVPFGKMDSFGGPWVNVRVGVQYTGYLRFNGGVSNYDGSGRSASQNNSVFVFYWMAF